MIPVHGRQQHDRLEQCWLMEYEVLKVDAER
jgi:hypothetical protein